ncbi:conserved hypothetical protein [Denitrovibrio acetiphilus DSM 12809]|uniref:Cytochrome C n=1 Tax=Denitrovibrio acetiphilus (strain DSM 12809 / NBRC 114555 / N2460) TaxID=522772 RepID=D4H674_DENA2|nr:hypothetical protein [Denitrovibrio acetiphilus]ADD67720.1 conserved hypothetical protein [Denitrovibrio acetiphilus DSM 12809]
MKRFRKSNIYAGIALCILIIAFVFPVMVYHKVPEKIASGNIESIPSYIAPVWDLYQTGRYVSPYTPQGAEKDFKELVKRRAEIGVPSVPVWFVSLEAPNYPKEAFPNGIPVYFHMDGYSGDVHEMNTINHFIGMYPMERGGRVERIFLPYLLLFEVFLFLLFMTMKHRVVTVGMLLPVLFPAGFLAFYSGWLYWYGHNLQEWGMFKVKPFMPTVFGDGKVAQFTTHSYPSLGFYLLLVISALSILAILSRRNES